MNANGAIEWIRRYEAADGLDRKSWVLGKRRPSNAEGGSTALVLSRSSDAICDPAKPRIVSVPPTIAPDAALAAPILATMLAVWEELHLELGEIAVVTGDGVHSSMAGVAATICGALPVVHLGRQVASHGELHRISVRSDESEACLDRLRGIMCDGYGVAAVELSGQAGVLDLLLESLPRYSRLMLAGSRSQPATIDYYNNIHRKGVFVLTRDLEPAAHLGTTPGKGMEDYLRRAFILLEDRDTACRCVDALLLSPNKDPLRQASD